MKKIIFIILSVLLVIVFLFSIKIDTDIYIDLSPLSFDEKIDMQIVIDDEIVFNDTLKNNFLDHPTRIIHPMRMGFHTILVYSQKASIHKSEKFFLLFNQYLALYSGRNTVYIDKGNGIFYYE